MFIALYELYVYVRNSRKSKKKKNLSVMEKVPLEQVFRPVFRVCSLSSARYSCQNGKREKPGNLPKSNAAPAVGDH